MKKKVFWITYAAVAILLVSVMGLIPALLWLLLAYLVLKVFKKVGAKIERLFSE